MQWTLNGPDKDWFTRAELLAYLGVSDTTLTRLINLGVFPRGIRVSPHTPERWGGLDVAAFFYLRGRCRDSADEGGEDSSSPQES